MVDCCLYFGQQGGLEKSNASANTHQTISTVNLLMARPLTNKEQQIIDKDGNRFENPSKLSTSDEFCEPVLGVMVQHIDEFHRRWRQLTPEK